MQQDDVFVILQIKYSRGEEIIFKNEEINENDYVKQKKWKSNLWKHCQARHQVLQHGLGMQG